VCIKTPKCFLLFIRALPEGTWLAQWHYERLKVPHVGKLFPRLTHASVTRMTVMVAICPHATICVAENGLNGLRFV